MTASGRNNEFVIAPKRVELVREAQAAITLMRATGMGYEVAEVHAYLTARIAGPKPSKPKSKSWRG